MGGGRAMGRRGGAARAPAAVVSGLSAAAVAVALVSGAGPAAAAAGGSPLGGKYSDPNHPGCARAVNTVAGTVTGADGTGPGGACEAGKPVKEWSLSAVVAKDGQSLTVDFSPKGGPKDLTGKWNGKDGISWPDGNTWTKQQSSVNVDYPTKADAGTDLGKGAWTPDRLSKRMGGFY